MRVATHDKAVARRVEWIGRLFEEVGSHGVGFVFDTCHLWAGGEPLDEVVPRLLEATGRIDLVQANDSKDEFDSRRDRHENLGHGVIPEQELARIGGVKTLISHNYYGEAEFWSIWNRRNYERVKARTDPRHLFRDLYTLTCRAAMGID